MDRSPQRFPVVLLVDPSLDDRAMQGDYLRANGCSVVECATGPDALARASTVDVVVTAIDLSGPFDGIELVRRLRAAENTHDKTIVVLTVCKTEPAQMRAAQAGCDVFLPKPCAPETLLAEIFRALALRVRVPRPTMAKAEDAARAQKADALRPKSESLRERSRDGRALGDKKPR